MKRYFFRLGGKVKIRPRRPASFKWRTHRTRLTFAISFFALAAPVLAQGDQPSLKIGDAAPSLQLDELRQTPLGAPANREAQMGKVVVIDFWATWCAPCIASLPHLNQLTTELAGEPVTFIAVTDDPPAKVAEFLKTHPITTWLGFDHNRANWHAFDVVSIPHCVVIGRDGKVAAITLPEDVTAESLRKLSKNEPVVFAPKQGRSANANWDQDWVEWTDGVRPETYLIIKPIVTSTTESYYPPHGGRLTADGASLPVLIMLAYGTDFFHLDLRSPLIKQSYRVAVHVRPGREAMLQPWLQQTLQTMFDINAHWEDEEQTVFALSRAPDSPAPPASVITNPMATMVKGSITLKGQSTSTLANMLTTVLRAPVANETGLNGIYDFELPYQPGDVKMTTDALGKLGFRVDKVRRLVKMLVVESADKT
jgi:uncharacterized protein (TIGR03435 family)